MPCLYTRVMIHHPHPHLLMASLCSKSPQVRLLYSLQKKIFLLVLFPVSYHHIRTPQNRNIKSTPPPAFGQGGRKEKKMTGRTRSLPRRYTPTCPLVMTVHGGFRYRWGGNFSPPPFFFLPGGLSDAMSCPRPPPPFRGGGWHCNKDLAIRFTLHIQVPVCDSSRKKNCIVLFCFFFVLYSVRFGPR